MATRYTAANQSAMLALSAAVGDFCLRTDTVTVYRLTSLPASTLGNWALRPFRRGQGAFLDPLTSEWWVGRRDDVDNWGSANAGASDASGAPAGGGSTGTALLDFGPFPGSSDASVTVTGQTLIATNSIVQAWIRPDTTDDHSPDEHWLETLKVTAGNIVAGTGFTIYGMNTSQLNEPASPTPLVRFGGTGQFAGPGQQDRATNYSGGNGTRLYGKFRVAWSWQ